jgi:hypothetical protein
MITDTSIAYPNYGDLVTGSCRLIVSVHSNTEQVCQSFVLKTPPSIPLQPLVCFVWAPFKWPERAILYAHGDPSFNVHAVNNNGLPPLCVSQISKKAKGSFPQGIKFMYHLHRAQDNANVLIGFAVTSVDGLCPAFDPTSNSNLFGYYLGVEFTHAGHSYMQVFLPFKFNSCFCLSNDLTYKLSHHANTFCLDAGIPALTSAKIFEQTSTSALATSTYMSQTSMQHLPSACRHFSTVPLVYASRIGSTGFRLIKRITSFLPFAPLSRTLAQ